VWRRSPEGARNGHARTRYTDLLTPIVPAQPRQHANGAHPASAPPYPYEGDLEDAGRQPDHDVPPGFEALPDPGGVPRARAGDEERPPSGGEPPLPGPFATAFPPAPPVRFRPRPDGPHLVGSAAANGVTPRPVSGAAGDEPTTDGWATGERTAIASPRGEYPPVRPARGGDTDGFPPIGAVAAGAPTEPEPYTEDVAPRREWTPDWPWSAPPATSGRISVPAARPDGLPSRRAYAPGDDAPDPLPARRLSRGFPGGDEPTAQRPVAASDLSRAFPGGAADEAAATVAPGPVPSDATSDGPEAVPAPRAEADLPGPAGAATPGDAAAPGDGATSGHAGRGDTGGGYPRRLGDPAGPTAPLPDVGPQPLFGRSVVDDMIDELQLPQRVPAEPDVPTIPEPLTDLPAEAPQLARIATHLRRDDLPETRERPDGFDVDAILAAVRGVSGVKDASLRTTPAGAHSLRLDLADGADPAEVSRHVARLLQERMGLAAAPQNLPEPPASPVTRGGLPQPAPADARAVGGAAARSFLGSAAGGAPAAPVPPEPVGGARVGSHAETAAAAGGEPAPVEEAARGTFGHRPVADSAAGPARSTTAGSFAGPVPASAGDRAVANPARTVPSGPFGGRGGGPIGDPAATSVSGGPADAAGTSPSGPVVGAAGSGTAPGRGEAPPATSAPPASVGGPPPGLASGPYPAAPGRTTSAGGRFAAPTGGAAGPTASGAASTTPPGGRFAARASEATDPSAGNPYPAAPGGTPAGTPPAGVFATGTSGTAGTSAARASSPEGPSAAGTSTAPAAGAPAAAAAGPTATIAGGGTGTSAAFTATAGEEPAMSGSGAVTGRPEDPEGAGSGRIATPARPPGFEPAQRGVPGRRRRAADDGHPRSDVDSPAADPGRDSAEAAGGERSARSRRGVPTPAPGSFPQLGAAAGIIGSVGGHPVTATAYSGGQISTTESAPSRPLNPGSPPGPRVVIDHVQVSTFGLDATVETRLAAGKRRANGLATGPAVDGYVLRLCAVSAASAIDELLRTAPRSDDRGRCFVEHAAVVPFGNCEVAVVVVLLVCNGWVEQLAGSALVSGDPRQAVVRATLAAVNRRLEALLSD